MTELRPSVTLEVGPRRAEDLVALLEGSVVIRIGPERRPLHEGDSLQYPADHSVRCHNPCTLHGEILWISAGS